MESRQNHHSIFGRRPQQGPRLIPCNDSEDDFQRFPILNQSEDLIAILDDKQGHSMQFWKRVLQRVSRGPMDALNKLI
jgi:hypothetical protein